MPASTSPDSAGAIGKLLGDYAGLPNRHDECRAPDGSVRPLWAEFFRLLGPNPSATLQSAGDACRRAVLDHEVNMNVYTGQGSGAKPWPLDVVPLLLGSEDWADISAGLRQRARLFNTLLQDVYGPQKLLADGSLPASLLMANPQFQRPCVGLARHKTPFLQTYAADIARSPDGRWWVLDDRLDAPSGLGYSLQNRILVRQILPETFHRAPVVHYHSFFNDYQDSLRALAPRTDSPLIVLLTPGQANESYFEQSYLARHLGCPLVEGEDLTTRDGHVYLRTVGGLKRVSVILRRVDSDFCDPLELNHRSLLGVPGLVNAAQAGRVGLSNQLGASALESNALLAFLQPLCRQLFDEDLLIPSAATWWAGQTAARDYVLNNLHGLVIKPTFRGGAIPSKVYGGDLAPAERDRLAKAIRARPADYCGQERVLLGTTPAWNGHALAPVPYVLRVYLSWKDGDYRVLPGGLARFHPDGVDGIVSLHQGSTSKDTWVISGEERGARLPAASTLTAAFAARPPASTPSRLADHLYWFGRYLERTGQIARALEKIGPLLRDEVATLDPAVASDAVALILRLQDLPPPPETATTEEMGERIRAVAADPALPGSLAANLARLSRILETVKIHLPPEAAQAARRVRHLAETGAVVSDLADLRAQLSSLDGLVAETIPHDTAWRFLDLGRRVERAMQLLYAVQAFLQPGEAAAPTEFRLQTLLLLTSGLFTYRAAYQSVYLPVPVLASMLGSVENPRSVRFQADRIEEHLGHLPDELAPRAVDDLRTAAFRLVSAVRLAEPAALAEASETIAALAGDLIGQLAGLHTRIGAVYFSHVEQVG